MTELEQRHETLKDLGVDSKQLPSLQVYLNHLMKSNEELNLVSRKMTANDLVDNHLIDCLLPFQQFPKDLKSVADFGSGGGLPGVIYAILIPQIQFHLFEKSPRKQEFLISCRSFAPNIHVHGEIPRDLKEIDLVMARGFKPVDVILEMSREYYDKGGKYFLLKARREKIDEEIRDSLKKFKNLKVDIITLNSPVLAVERHLLRI